MSDNATSPAQNADQKLGDQKLKLAGYSYVLGDAAMVGRHAVRGGWEKAREGIAGGTIWALGGLAAGRYGNPNADKQLELIANKLERHLNKNGITIPDGIREQNALLKKETLWQRVEDFLYEHPSEMLNGAYALGAGMLVKQGLQERAAGTHTLMLGSKVSTTFWMGVIVSTGALIGLLAKEDPQAREKAKNGSALDKAVAFVREKPLRTTSALYFANNGFLAAAALDDYKNAKLGGEFFGKAAKPHYFSTLQLATYLFSNAMLALSSRDQISGDMDAQHLAQLEDAAARILAAQPGEVQQAMLSDMSRYLAEQKGVGQDAPKIAQDLATRLTQITGQRAQQAADTVSWAAREQARMQAAPAQTTL